MKLMIADAFADSSGYYAACTGPQITRDMKCLAVIAGGRTYPIKAVCVGESFTGVLQAMLEIDGPHLPPIGECQAITSPR